MSVFKRYKGKRITSKHPAYHKARWWVWKRINGRIIHRSIPEAQNKEQAELAERKLVEAAFNHRYGVVDSTTTFSSFVDGPYTRYVEQHNVNKGAKYLYIRLLKKEFKKLLLSEITPQDCRDAQYHLRRLMSDSSVNRVMSTASKIFTLACEEGLLDRSPMQYVKTLKEPPRRSRLLTNEERQRLWKELATDSLMERLVILAINLPLRKGQLLAITPDAIDEQHGILLTIASKGRPPRMVPVNTTAMTIFRLMKSDGQLPFPLKDFRKRWWHILKNANITNFTFHDLRKEFSWRLRQEGTDSKDIQHLFAHSDMRITDIYIVEDFEAMKRAVNRLDATIPQPPQEITGLPN